MAGQVGTPEGPALSGPLARPDPGPVWGPNWQGQLDEADAQMAAARRLFADPHPRGVFGTIGHAFANIADHFTALKKFSELMGATAALCGVVGLFPPLAFLEPVALAATGLKTLSDVDLAATGRRGWGDVTKDGVGLALFGAGRIATVGARGSLAAKASEDLAEVRRAGELGHLDDQSGKLLRELHEDDFTGKLPSWQRSMNAMRRPDIELPNSQQLTISLRAVKWAYGAKGAEFVGGVADEHEVAKLAREAGQIHHSGAQFRLENGHLTRKDPAIGRSE